ncbi:colorectal mutant cancer protein-like [Tigriopus californicus]|uniref:colorectal mutant cancer protein-like n=1 Tax=Tigriopus californicus TaxID=6832 RepID=UPI0027DA43F4|nr:colorectal mutant cancer protein-like [Tigriopus californicus]
MSCFTVNKLKEVVGAKSFLTAVKASPSPKRKAGGGKKSDACKESSTTNTDFVYHKSPQTVTKRNQEQVFAGSPVPSIHQSNEWDVVSLNPSSLETLSHLRDENQELSHRIYQIVEERDYFENSLSKVQLEKLRLMKERDDLLDKQSGRYEERLVELHSVIAELTRQLEEKTREHIPEESDEEENSTSLASTSPHDQSKTVSDLASGTSTDIIDAQAVEAGKRLVEQYGLDHPDLALFRLTSSCHASTNSLQMLAIQEELSDAKDRNIQLTARLQQRESDLSLVGKQLEEVTLEKERLRNQVKEFQNQVALLPPCVPISVGNKGGERAPRGQDSPDAVETSEAKMAEKKKIKRLECQPLRPLQLQSSVKENCEGLRFSSDDESQPKVTGLELVRNGISNKIVAEHLAKDIQDSSSMNELSHSFFDPSFFQSGFMEAKMREFEIEMERLSSRMESLKAQNEVLNLTLAEAKNNSDNLTVLIGRYESNNTAQNLAATYADHVIESLEVLNILIETEMGILLANCKMSGLDDLVSAGDLEASPEELLERARSNRKDAEQTARLLLQRLESVLRPDSGLEIPYPPPPPPIDAHALQWEDSSGYSQATSSASTSLDHKSMPLIPLGYGTLSVYDPEREHRPEDFHLREVIAELKHKRSSIRSTITKLEFSHPDNQEPEHTEPRSTITAKLAAARTADLEMAVLVQELMTMREERSDVRAQVYFLERENQSLKLVINSHQEQEGILRSHIRHLETELDAQDISLNELTQSDFHQLRTDMRCRITELLQSLEKVKRNSELRQHQQDEVIADLKRSNATLFESLERTRKKYQSKMKRMERQILQSFIPKELMSNNCDIQSQPGSIYSSLSTETDQTSD